MISPDDAGFADLCVWLDLNHDGFSQASEVLSLAQAGVARLDYRYVETRRQDEHGNLFRYKSRAWARNPAGHIREISSYDVFFVSR